MKKLSALLLLFALACTTAAPVPSARPRPVAADSVNVAIESRPDSAEVYIEGKFVGTTPMVARLMPGEHPIELRHPKYETWQRELTVISNSPTRIMAHLATR
ncbi:MAG TPA: PEGA domain-containing protein [Thermoanaerobaculia bacterium]|nr:PEGA domain-containing protein [Thermoanaerobaculia bacterium]